MTTEELLDVDPDIKLENRARLEYEAFIRLAQDLAGQRSVRFVVDWLCRHDPPLKMEDMVTQDEFSHDLLVPYGKELFLVYDST